MIKVTRCLLSLYQYKSVELRTKLVKIKFKKVKINLTFNLNKYNIIGIQYYYTPAQLTCNTTKVVCFTWLLVGVRSKKSSDHAYTSMVGTILIKNIIL